METSEHHELSEGRGPLELLCHTAMMQGDNPTTSEPMVEIEPLSAPCTETSQIDDLLKPLPALSSEPGSPSNFPCVFVSSRAKATSKWAPPSFVALKKKKKPSVVPQSPTLRISMDPGSLHLPLLQAKLEEGLLDSSRSEMISSPQSRIKSYPCPKQLIRENVQLKIELGDAKKEIAKLKKEMNRANCNISELRSLSGGNKISEIPLADMIEIMQEYGSEVSGQSFQKRKEDPQPASIVRQFRRWNPDFLKYFCRKNGKWIPKLGKAGELQRRQLKREALKAHRRNPPQGPPERNP